MITIPVASADTANVPPSLVVALATAVAVLAGVIAYLWRYYSGRMQAAEDERRKMIMAHAEERDKWAIERTTLQGFREQLRAEHAQRYAEDIRRLYDQGREREDQLRRENAESAALVAKVQAENMAKIGDALNKLADRMGGGKRTGQGTTY